MIRSLIPFFVLLLSGFSEAPPSDMTWEEIPSDPGKSTYIVFTYPNNGSKFLPIGATEDFKGALLVPQKCYETKCILRAHFYGYSAKPTFCYNRDNSVAGYATTKNCPDHYPDMTLLSPEARTWGGPYLGELPLSWRIAAQFKHAHEYYADAIDIGAGIHLRGCSYGGTTSILQAMLMTDQWAKANLSVINACVPHTRVTIGPLLSSADHQAAWGDFDWTLANTEKYIPRSVYSRINGSPVDKSAVFDLSYFTDVCDAGRRPCFGTWHDCGHNQYCPGVNLPLTAVYTDTGMSHRLDQPQVAFTNSSANDYGVVGHYNLGLAWQDAGMIRTLTSTEIPLRYIRWTGIRADVADQPETVTFDVTVRRTYMTLPVGAVVMWQFGTQSGTATVAEAGAVTIEGLTMTSGPIYTALRIWQ